VPEEVADPVPEPLAASLVGGAVLFLDVLCQHPGAVPQLGQHERLAPGADLLPAVPEGIGIGSLPGGRGGRLLELIEDLLPPAGGALAGAGAAEHLLGVHPPEAHPAASGPAASAAEASGRAAPSEACWMAATRSARRNSAKRPVGTGSRRRWSSSPTSAASCVPSSPRAYQERSRTPRPSAPGVEL